MPQLDMSDLVLLIAELHRCRAEEREAHDDLVCIEQTIGNMQHTHGRMKGQLLALTRECVATEIILSAAALRLAELDVPGGEVD